MARFLHSVCSFCTRKRDKLVLAFFWVLGLLVGDFVFRYGRSTLLSLMSLAVTSRPSFLGLLVSSFIPFLFSAYAVYIGFPWLLHGICFFKAAALGYLAKGIFTAFGSVGWLIRWLFLFTDIISSAVLYCYCCRHISGVRKMTFRNVSAYGILLAVISIFDHRVISALLVRVIGK